MNDLPTPPQGTNPTPASAAPPPPQANAVIGGGISSKEKEISASVREVSFRPVGIEKELPPEVVSSGVKVRPTSIPIPPPVIHMGVQPAGQNVPAASPAITLPLSDVQIAQGLKQSITSSWRWLAQWCVRKLKQVHMGLKTIHGKLTRVRE